MGSGIYSTDIYCEDFVCDNCGTPNEANMARTDDYGAYDLECYECGEYQGSGNAYDDTEDARLADMADNRGN